MSKLKSTLPLLYTLVLLLASVMAINALSAYIRHAENGVGCQPWPACYGVVGQTVDRNSQQAVTHALTPQSTAKRWHRALVTVMVVLLAVTLVLASGSRGANLPLRPAERKLPWLMTVIVIVLAVIGPASYLKTMPLIALLNLLGGLALLLCVWRLLLAVAGAQRVAAESLRPRLRFALRAMLVTTALGGWVSANFAVTACSQLTCIPDAQVSVSAFWPFRSLTIDAIGRIVTDSNAALIHVVHRIAVLATIVYVVSTVLKAWRDAPMLRSDVLVLALLLTVQVLLGVAMVVKPATLNGVLLHHLTASMLLMSLVRLRHRTSGDI